MKKLMRALLTLILLTSMTFSSYAGYYSISKVGKNDQIAIEQYQQILDALRIAANANDNGRKSYVDTGIRCESREDAEALMHCFKYLFLADDEFSLIYNWEGNTNYYSAPEDQYESGWAIWSTVSGKGDRQAILAGWNPLIDANELLREHDEAKAVIDTIVSSAPDSPYEKVKYFNDTLAEMITYDWEGYNSGNSKHSPYYGLVEGTCVCSGYADAFFNLCFYGGVNSAVSDCITSSSTDGTANHRINMVNLDGRWKKVDVTWNDTDPGIRYTYFMKDMDDGWQNHINRPYMVYVEE